MDHVNVSDVNVFMSRSIWIKAITCWILKQPTRFARLAALLHISRTDEERSEAP